MSSAPVLTNENFEETIKRAGSTPVMVDFYAEWCGPCKISAPIIDELANEHAGKLQVYKVDVDVTNELARQYGVMSIPTVVMFKNGEEINRIVGFPGKAGYVQLIESALSAPETEVAE
jgi:thioredoxin 1